MRFLCLGALLAAPLLGLAQELTDKATVRQLLEQRRLPEARQAAMALVQQPKDSLDPEAWNLRGEASYALIGTSQFRDQFKGEFIDLEAYYAYRKCLQLDRNQKWLGPVQEDYYQLCIDFISTANDYYDKGLSNKNNPRYLSKAAEYYEAFLDMWSKMGNGQTNLRKIIEQNGLDLNTITFFCAVCQDRTGNTNRAFALYEDLAMKGYNEPDVYGRLRSHYQQEGQPQLALDLMKRASTRFPNDAEYALEYVRMLCEFKQWPEATAVANKAIKSDRNSIFGYIALAEVYERQKDFKRAEQTYKEALKREGEEFPANYYISRFYLRRAGEDTPFAVAPAGNSRSTARSGKTSAATTAAAPAEASRKPLAPVTDAEVRSQLSNARTHLEAAYDLNPLHEETRHLLYEVYVKLGDEQKADYLRARLR